MAEEVIPIRGGRCTEMSSEEVAQLKQLLGETPKPLDVPHCTNPHLSPWQPLRAKPNDINEATQSTAPPNDRIKRSIDSESGAEADDEHCILGVPASRLKHKISKRLERTTSNSTISGLSDNQDGLSTPKSSKERQQMEARVGMHASSRKRRIELLRRVLEVGLLLVLGCIVHPGNDEAVLWRIVLIYEAIIIGGLMILYPVRLLYHFAWPSIVVPSSFDPAVLLYPPLLANYASILLAQGNGIIIFVNITLGISSLPAELLPSFALTEGLSTFHWMLSCVPLCVWQARVLTVASDREYSAVIRLGESVTYLFPLHHTTCAALRHIVSTSLLETEVQLLSIALINLTYLAKSPTMIVLKALLWIGGASLAYFGTSTLRWLVAVDRVPKWRFSGVGSPKHALKSQPKSALKEPLSKLSQVLHFDRPPTLDSEDDVASVKRVKPVSLRSEPAAPSAGPSEASPSTDAEVAELEVADTGPPLHPAINANTIRLSQPLTHTPSGRKKRSASKSLARFYDMTETEATIKKYIYAGHIYVVIVLTAFVGVWSYVFCYAFISDVEPVGWALSYLFGDLHWFRWNVTVRNLNSWIVLPRHINYCSKDSTTEVAGAWVEQWRDAFGHANTRLLISAYLLGILIIGLTAVFSLARIPSVAVDTRRKVFHFMMVAMLTPTIFIDPTYIAFALTLILAVFLLLEVLRSGCVPPFSKPLNWFLAPYVDGRDLRGPVVVSHIFLLIGCAIPLWLSLGASEIATSGKKDWIVERNWNIVGRDVSMLAGVICVGMGDAFASLIGRRYGRNKWIWPGGKTIEGSVAFAVAVTASLLVGKAYLTLGGWVDVGTRITDWESAGVVAGKSVLAATLASLTEAVLTGGNDNVVVPVVFWMCVKGLKI